MRAAYGNRIANPQWARSFENGTLAGQVDLARLRRGRSGGAFWSIYAPCPAKSDDFSDENLAASKGSLDSSQQACRRREPAPCV